MYNVFLKDFNVLEDEDFEIEIERDEEDEQNDTENTDFRQITEREKKTKILHKRWKKQAKRSILWILILGGAITWTILYSGLV